jgi:CheY-like chemotaxis protein
MKTLSILLVDDNEADRYLFRRQLKGTGLSYKLFEEEDGQYALEFFQNYEENKSKFPEEYPPLLVFLDINMPLLDGLGFLEQFSRVRAGLPNASTVVLMLTSSLSESDRQTAESYHFVKGYMEKGHFSIDELKQEIEQVLKEAEAN